MNSDEESSPSVEAPAPDFLAAAQNTFCSAVNTPSTCALNIPQMYGYDYTVTTNALDLSFGFVGNVVSGGTNEWTKTYTDMAGRAYKTVYAGSGPPSSIAYYNSRGQPTNSLDPDDVSTLYAYNPKGEPAYTITDSNRNYTVDWTGSDRITFVTNDVTADNGANVRRTRTYVWSTSANASTLVSTAEFSTDGLQTWNTTWNNGVAATRHTATVYAGSGYRYLTNAAPDGSYTLSVYQYRRLISLTQYDGSAAHNQIAQTTYAYDAHGRQNAVTDARNGTTTYTFNNADQVVTATTPPPGAGQASQTTTTYYDTSLRAWKITQPDGTSLTNSYDVTGLLTNIAGTRTYPVAYTYDAQGRIKTMTTWRNYDARSGAATTTWNYDIYRGWLTNKTYNGGTAGPLYAYTAAGRLQSRAWARGTNTTYTYNNAGDLSGVTYNDGATPGLAFGYDRRGRQTSVTQGANATTALAYNDANQLLSEACGGSSPLSGLSVTNGYDQCLRRTNAVGRSQSSALSTMSFAYDAASRLQTVNDGNNNSATYSCLANSPLVQQIVFANNGTTRMTTTKQYDYVNRLTQISSVPSQASTLSFAYAYNAANQRTSLTMADSSYWVYAYDSLGQVTSGKKYWSDGTPVAGQQFQYQFDTIGNRTGTDAAGDQNGANLHHANYTLDSAGLNQYVSRDVPGYVQSLGTASASANVALWTANRSYAQAPRKGTYFRAELAVANGSTPLWVPLTNLALLPGGASADVLSTAAGSLFVPKTPEAFGYDADGNLTNDGHWRYTWDAENRLVRMTNYTGVGPQQLLIFEYDWKGRRIHKQVSASGTMTNNVTFVYDVWNPIAQLNATNSNVIQSYTWGLDLSGSPQGAGGAGGLLAVSDALNGVHFAAYDGNGNVAGLVKASDGTTSALYEYGPFGEPLRATGLMAKANPFRLSTKYQDDETDLLYYGYRYYSASMGRWLSHDPLTDEAFLEIYSAGNAASKAKWLKQRALLPPYVFAVNDPISRHDCWGLYENQCCDAQTIAIALKILIARYSDAETYLDVYRPDEMPEEGSWSCLNVARNLAQFLAPIPPCWTCYMEERWSRWRPFGAHDLNVVVCVSHPLSGTPQKVFFDYWHHEPPAQDYSVFVKNYPKPGEVGPPAKQSDCCGGLLPWPTPTTYDWLLNITGGGPPPIRPQPGPGWPGKGPPGYW